MATIDYKEKYEQALERARQFSEKPYLEDSAGIVEYIFPELKESEDERIIGRIKKAVESYWSDEPLDEILAWLEKQVEHAKFRDSIQIGDKVTRNEDGVLVNLSQLKRVAKKDEKQGKNNMGISEATKQKLENNLNKTLEKETPESWNKFLDEQGEQKPIDKIDSSKIKKDPNPYWTLAPEYQLANKQKPADKVEPKFKVGDWVVYTGYLLKDSGKEIYVMQVASVEDDRYNFTDTSTLCFDSEKDMRSWTIQDAKDGDVLASNRSIFIFSQEYMAGKTEAHCGTMNGLFIVKPEGCWTNEKCYPATKEQRDALERAITNAGYRWDKENLKLEKI